MFTYNVNKYGYNYKPSIYRTDADRQYLCLDILRLYYHSNIAVLVTTMRVGSSVGINLRCASISFSKEQKTANDRS